jgi:hypothetical protein
LRKADGDKGEQRPFLLLLCTVKGERGERENLVQSDRKEAEPLSVLEREGEKRENVTMGFLVRFGMEASDRFR